MLLKINNLGPVKRAEFSLGKKMTVLCGVNNTGKTYVSYLLYYLFSDNQDFMLRPFVKIDYEKSKSYQITLDVITRWLESFSSYIKQNVSSIYGISFTQSNELFGDFSLEMHVSEAEFNEIISRSLKQKLFYQYNEITILKRKKSRTFNFTVNSQNPQAAKIDIDLVLSISMNLVFRRLILDCYRSFMFTVERNSIYTFKNELSLTRNELLNKIIESADRDTASRVEANRYPVAIFDSLRIANDIANISKQKGKFYELASQIESELLQGKVITSDIGDISLQIGEEAIPIHITSSIVKTLSSFVLYLKHQAIPGDVVLIDEPEMNFHPFNQIIVARLFARLSNMGIRFIISTHSDYVIRELNNLVMAGELIKGNAEYVKKMGYESSLVLAKDDMGVYNFIRRDDGVHVDSIVVSEMGFPVESIDNAIESQNAATELLYGKLMEQE